MITQGSLETSVQPWSAKMAISRDDKRATYSCLGIAGSEHTGLMSDLKVASLNPNVGESRVDILVRRLKPDIGKQVLEIAVRPRL